MENEEKFVVTRPQQKNFILFYNNPQSPTFGNKYQSAIKAGYSHNYAIKIGQADPLWFRDHCRHGQLLEKAENVLDEMLDIVPEDAKELKIKQDTAKFVASSVGKEIYSTRRELTGKEGKKLFTKKSKVKVEKVLDDFLGEGPAKVTMEQEVDEI